MKSNQHLKEIALLGSSRKPLDTALVPKVIASILESKSFENVEDKVLEALSLQHYYSQAGSVPQQYTGEILATPIEESNPVIDDALEDIFKQIIDLEIAGKDRLMNSWLNTVIRKSQIISANQIVPILKFAKTSSKKIKSKVLQVIGDKGKWVMNQSEAYVIPKMETLDEQVASSKIWTEGNSKARKEHFESLRKINKASAIELLESTWDEEAIRDKMAFLKIIKLTNDISDIPFLEELYHSEFQFKPKEKKLVKACRRIIVDTLLAIPSSELHQKTISQFAKYIGNQKSKGLLSKVFSKNKSPFILPNEHDDFWNPQVMVEAYGFEDSNPDIARYKSDALYWFSCFVQSIPFQNWKTILNLDRKSTLDFFLKDQQFVNVIKGKEESNLLLSLVEMANNHQDQELILLLIKSIGRYDNVELLKLLTPENWEKYIIKKDLFYQGHVLASCNLEEGEEWSKKFTDTLVKNITKKLHEQKITLDYQIGATASIYFNVDSLPLLKRIHQSEANILVQYNWWQKHFYGRIVETTSIRSLLKNYK